MHQLPIEQQILVVIEIAALVILCLRLWRADLYKTYACFFCYLVLELLQALIPVLIPVQSHLYLDFYDASQAIIVAFSVLVVLELYSKVLRDLPGLAGTARRYIEATLSVALLIAFLLLRLGKTVAGPLGYVMSFERTVMASLVVFVLLVSAFLLYYPILLGKNVVAYLAGYAAWFLTKATTSLVMNLEPEWLRSLNAIAMTVAVLCLTFWIFALSREGEDKRIVVGHQWNPDEDRRLLAQLDAINASLQRSRGKESHY